MALLLSNTHNGQISHHCSLPLLPAAPRLLLGKFQAPAVAADKRDGSRSWSRTMRTRTSCAVQTVWQCRLPAVGIGIYRVFRPECILACYLLQAKPDTATRTELSKIAKYEGKNRLQTQVGMFLLFMQPDITQLQYAARLKYDARRLNCIGV